MLGERLRDKLESCLARPQNLEPKPCLKVVKQSHTFDGRIGQGAVFFSGWLAEGRMRGIGLSNTQVCSCAGVLGFTVQDLGFRGPF